MNLEDYAYNEDGRWYVDPNVSLRERSDFIGKLRSLQAQDNAQIEKQTRGLGTQVPSQLGGLVGAGSYFKSRFQTPQTNQTVAELKSKMQNQALEKSIENELAKGKKKYQDAYRAAQERGSNKDSDNSPLYNQLNGLKTNANGTTPDKEIYPSIDKVNSGEVGQDEHGNLYIKRLNGEKVQLFYPSQYEAVAIGNIRDWTLTPPDVNAVIEVGNNKYIYTTHGWYRLGITMP